MPSFAEYVVSQPRKLEALTQAYLEDVTKGGTWGAEVEARHLARIFNVHVVFWAESETGRFRLVQQYIHGTTTLHILCRGAHFEALREAPVEGAEFNRSTVVTNVGVGDCLYRAFHQAYRRHGAEPSTQALKFYRAKVAEQMRLHPELDLEGLLTTLLDEVELEGFALGAGPTLQRMMRKLYREYRAAPVEGGGSIPPFGRTPDSSLGIGELDPVPRKELSIADRLLDRIGRLVSTVKSVHVALALDDKALVVSMNDDTAGVLTALTQLVTTYTGGGPMTDPHAGSSTAILRVPRTQTMVFHKPGRTTTKFRRNVDLEKLDALRSGKLELLTSGKTKDKLARIKAALAAGVLTDTPTQTAEQQYLAGATGIYFIPHVPRTADTGVVHGEMNVTAAIQRRRTGKGLKDDVFVGGTLIDCFDCNKAHKARNETLSRTGEQWRFYSGGTHGNSFPNWFLAADSRDLIDRDTFSRERFPGGVPSFPWWDHRNRAGEYGYDDPHYVWKYYYMAGPVKRYTENRYAPGPRGRENRSERVLEPIRWEATARTYLTDLFLRNAKVAKIVQAHSSFADDSDSDTEDYDELIVRNAETRKQQRLALQRSYAEESLDLGFVMDVEASLPITFEQARGDGLMTGALVLFAGPVLTMPRIDLYLSPELMDLLQTPDWMRPTSTRQEPFPVPPRREAPSSRPMLRLGGPEGGARGGTGAPGLMSPGDLRQRLGAFSLLPAERGDGLQALTPRAGEGISFELGHLFDLFWMLGNELGVKSVQFSRSFDEVLDAFIARVLRARASHSLDDGRFAALVLVMLYLKHVLRLTRLGAWTLENLLRALGESNPRARLM
ncbi:hypothetical protein ACQKGO_26680 [Corallococcus interemptor]|uniref:hypothetical protein n=1 Tax=Corallococcus interemptor TaxID=2316720 RepID=UPI003D08D5AA